MNKQMRNSLSTPSKTITCHFCTLTLNLNFFHETRTLCTSADDCTSLCTNALANVTSTPIITCDIANNNNGEGVCVCGDGTQIADLVVNILSGIAQVACQVFNEALEIGTDIATAIIPEAAAATAAEKVALAALKKALKFGSKDDVTNFCSGVSFTEVSSDIFSNVPRAIMTAW